MKAAEAKKKAKKQKEMLERTRLAERQREENAVRRQATVYAKRVINDLNMAIVRSVENGCFDAYTRLEPRDDDYAWTFFQALCNEVAKTFEADGYVVTPNIRWGTSFSSRDKCLCNITVSWGDE